ncbi:hypothetical protein GTQ40_14575 [Flavobacteriaceae bacterium R38]|nr:hypothetical protein [Flavobacteriaceae bacterium R38]
MRTLKLFYIAIFISFSVSCQKQIPVDDITNQPVFNEADTQYKNVFKVLDGTWKGKFLIYQDQQLGAKNSIELKDISEESIKKNGFKLINSIDVTQVYTSESPYFQKVTITDYYPDTKKQEVSNGVNKIQDGHMWCVVRKPNETVIHDGITDGDDTIIWSRNEKAPQRIEYFKETVSTNTYEIVGWGYYEGDDPEKSPKLWFYAKYDRQ